MIEQRERKIYIKDLLLDVIAKWKSIFVGAIVVCVLFSAANYVIDKNQYQEQSNNTQQVSEGSFTVSEKNAIENYMYLRDRVMHYEVYCENSYIMKLNPKKVEKIRLQYYVDSEYTYNLTEENEKDYTDSIVMMYSGYFTSKDFVASIAPNLNATYFLELISSNVDFDSRIINLIVAVPDGVDAGEIYEGITRTVAEKENILQEVGTHKLVTVYASQTTELDNSIESKIYNTKKILTDTKIQATQLESSLTSLQMSYINNLYGIEQEEQEPIKPFISAKYIIVGFVLGVIFMVFYYIIASILSGKLQHSEDIRTMYSVNILGKVRNVKGATHEKDIEYLAARVKVLCQTCNIQKLYITGSSISKIDNKFVEDIVAALKNLLEDVSSGDNVCVDATSLEKAKKMDNVIVIEKIGVSHYDDIAEQLQIISENDINIVGAITIK